MPADTRTLTWYENQDDSIAIKTNGWSFQIAQLVATSPTASPTYNIVWQSKGMAPSTTLSWKVQYALGWTADPPSEGITVHITGVWQPCNLGESYRVNDLGFWEPSTRSGQEGWLSAGPIDYSYPGVQGIHIVVGVWNLATAHYDPIFIDKTVLTKGSSGQYKPHEMVSWWLAGGNQTGQVFSSTQSNSTSWDFSIASDPASETYEYSTSYLMTAPQVQWVISKGAAPGHLTAPPPSAQLAALTLGGKPPVLIELDPAKWTVFFKKGMPGTVLSGAATALKNKLQLQLHDVKVTFSVLGNTTITVEYKPGGNTALLARGAGGASPKDIINGDLLELQTDGIIPADETWGFQPPILASTPAPAPAPAPTPVGGSPHAGQTPYGSGQIFQPGNVGKGNFAQNYQNGVAA